VEKSSLISNQRLHFVDRHMQMFEGCAAGPASSSKTISMADWVRHAQPCIDPKAPGMANQTLCATTL